MQPNSQPIETLRLNDIENISSREKPKRETTRNDENRKNSYAERN